MIEFDWATTGINFVGLAFAVWVIRQMLQQSKRMLEVICNHAAGQSKVIGEATEVMRDVKKLLKNRNEGS